MILAPVLSRCLACVVLAACMLVAGCSLTRESPVKQTYILDAQMPPAGQKTQPASVRVSSISIAAPFRSRNFIYRTGDLSFANDFYDEFLVPPSALLAEQTARALQSAHTFALVLPPGTSADADYILEGFVSALYVDQRTASRPAAELTIAYFLTSSSATVPMWTREYHQRVDLAGNTSSAYGAALNTALGEVLGELVRDLSALDLKKP